MPPAPPSLSEVKNRQNNLGETHKLSTVFYEVKFYRQGVLYKNAEHRPQPARSRAPPVPKNKHLILLSKSQKREGEGSGCSFELKTLKRAFKGGIKSIHSRPTKAAAAKMGSDALQTDRRVSGRAEKDAFNRFNGTAVEYPT